MGNGNLMSTLINPLGAISKQVGGPVGTLMDPISSFARSTGGTVGTLLDPAQAFEEKKVKEQPAVDYDAEARAKTLADKEAKGTANQAFDDLALRRQQAIGIKKTSLFNQGKEATSLTR